MTNLSEQNVAMGFILRKRDEFNKNFADLINKKGRILNKIDLQVVLKHSYEKRLKECEDTAEKLKRKETVIKKEIEDMIFSENFTADETFNQKRMELIKTQREFTDGGVLITENENLLKGTKEELKTLKEALANVEKEIPTNPYDIVAKILKRNEQKRKQLEDLFKIADIFKEQYGVDIYFDIQPHLSGEDFEVTEFTFGIRTISTTMIDIREDVEFWNGEYQDSHDIVYPVLNFERNDEFMYVFRQIRKEHLIPQTTMDKCGTVYIKDVFIKNPIPENEQEDYIRIGTKEDEAISKHVDLLVKGLVVEFSEYPYLFNN